MENSYNFKYRLEDLQFTPSKELVEVLYHQNEKFRNRIDIVKRFRDKHLFHLLLVQIVISIILVIISTFVISAGLFVSSKFEWLGVFGLFIAIFSLISAGIVIFLETLRGKGLRKKVVTKLIKFRFKMLKAGLRRHLPYEIKYVFHRDVINIQVLNKNYNKKINIKNFSRIIKTNDSFLFFRKEYSLNYTVAVRFANKTDEKMIEEFLSNNGKSWITYEELLK